MKSFLEYIKEAHRQTFFKPENTDEFKKHAMQTLGYIPKEVYEPFKLKPPFGHDVKRRTDIDRKKLPKWPKRLEPSNNHQD